MYFPYVRGRQNELLALRELVTNDLLSENIIPIIEPVKVSSTLFTTIEAFIKKKKKLAIICNSTIDSFYSDIQGKETDREKFYQLLESSFIIKSHIINKNSEKEILSWENERGILREDWLIILTERDYIEIYLNIFKFKVPQYLLA